MGLAIILTACWGKNNTPTPNLPNGVVTVKTEPTKKTVFLQLDEKTTLLPINIKAHPFKGKEVRALVSFKEDKKAPHEGYTKAVHVNWIDSILTKQMVPSTPDNDKAYGNDPVGLKKSNCLIEDGYLTLVFAARYGDVRKPHIINLVGGVDPNDPYLLELRHNAGEDRNGRTIAEGWVAFKLANLPDTKGEKKTLKIRFRTDTGTETIELDYITGKKADPKATLPTTRSVGGLTVE